MNQYTPMHKTEEGLSVNNWFLRVLNIVALAFEAYTAFYMISEAQQIQEPLLVFHGLSMVWSIAYHMFPLCTRNAVFRFVARTVATLYFMALVYNIYIMIMYNTGFDPIIYFSFLAMFTGPAALVNATLMWLMDADHRSSEDFGTQSYNIVYIPKPEGFTMI